MAVPEGIQPRDLVLRGGNRLTLTHGTIPNGSILVRDGRIAAIGATVEIPAGAEVVDIPGRFVTPGLIDAHSHIATDAINESGTTVSSMARMADVLNPTDVNIYRAVAGGVTTAHILHGSANPIGGTSAVIKMRWGSATAEDLLLEDALPGLKLALGENPKQLPRQLRAEPSTLLRYPTTRSGVEYVIREAFTRAQAHRAEWQAFERARAAGRQALPPRRDLQLEPLVEVLEGSRLVHAHAYRADETLMLIRLAEEMGFRIATFQHVLEGYRVAREIAAHGAGASTFSDWWGYKVEATDATPYNAAIMTRHGVLVSIKSDSAEHARRLNTEAAKSVKWGGLTDDEALALVTINPARQLRIDSRTGSLEPGKDADVTIWTHHPLSSYAVVDRTYVDGLLLYDRAGEARRLTDLQNEKTGRGVAAANLWRPPAGDPAAPQAAPVRPARAAPAAGETEVRTPGPSADDDASPIAPAAASAPSLAIVNARVHPVNGATIEQGTILIRGTRIEAVGAGLPVPAGTPVLDAAGGDVYPGFIDAATNMGLDDPGPRGFGDVGELLEINPQLRTRVAYRAESDAIPVARGNGITTVAVVPAGGLFGGEVAVMNLDGWTWEDATLRPNAGIQFTFPTLDGAPAGGRGVGRRPQLTARSHDDLRRDRDRKLADVVRLFDRVRTYAAAGPGRATDWTLEALVPVADRRLPLVTTANREWDIREAVAFAGRADVRMVIAGGAEANYVASLLSKEQVPVILGTRLSLPTREDDFHAASYQLAGELARAGVKVAFSSGESTNSRLLPYSAAISVAWGMDRDEAIRALTINAAEILGIADRVGTIEPGKDANLFISRGDPLEVRTQITHVIVQGRDVGTGNKHLALYEKYIRRP
jgi:imidazolonepropionase-like amidohydrolase